MALFVRCLQAIFLACCLVWHAVSVAGLAQPRIRGMDETTGLFKRGFAANDPRWHLGRLAVPLEVVVGASSVGGQAWLTAGGGAMRALGGWCFANPFACVAIGGAAALLASKKISVDPVSGAVSKLQKTGSSCWGGSAEEAKACIYTSVDQICQANNAGFPEYKCTLSGGVDAGAYLRIYDFGFCWLDQHTRCNGFSLVEYTGGVSEKPVAAQKEDVEDAFVNARPEQQAAIDEVLNHPSVPYLPVTTTVPAQYIKTGEPYQMDGAQYTDGYKISSAEAGEGKGAPFVDVKPETKLNVSAGDNNTPGTEKTPDLCALRPDILACQKLGEVPPETPRKESATVYYKKEAINLPSGCPAPIQLPGGQVLSYDRICEAGRSVSPLIVALGAFFGLMICVSSIRGS